MRALAYRRLVEIGAKWLVVVLFSLVERVLGPITALRLGPDPAESAAGSALGMTITASGWSAFYTAAAHGFGGGLGAYGIP